MALIQFRIHPSVGMARFGESDHWYFVGSEFPFFLQEQFPNLRPRPVARRHPALPAETPPTPDPGRYRDKDGRIMPQAARFRVFAYVYNKGSNEPYTVAELTPADADIEWTVTVANRKTVTRASGTDSVVLNDPAPVTLRTDALDPPQLCKKFDLPSLAWVALETGTLRLHVIGNEGADVKKQTSSTPAAPKLFQYDWFDAAADGPVAAAVKPKPAFLSRFPGFKFLIHGQKDPQSLPASGLVDALSAWVVVNMPDYIPEFGHIVSLWDVALDQGLRRTKAGLVKPADGRHLLVTSTEDNRYRFYDYHTHVHPQLAVFTDVTRTSGQARNASGKSGDTHAQGIVMRGTLAVAAVPSASTLQLGAETGLQLLAASMIKAGDPSTHFLILLASQDEDPFGAAHEFVRCTAITANGKVLSVSRAEQGTARGDWPDTTHWFAAPKGTFLEATSSEALEDADAATVLKVTPFVAHKMRQPSVAPRDQGDTPFLIAITDDVDVEWLTCTRNDKKNGHLTVQRAQLATPRRQWDAGSKIIATGAGHKNFDPRTHMKALAHGARGAAHQRIFERLRLPGSLYNRKYPGAVSRVATDPPPAATSFPREFGRRYDRTNAGVIDAVLPAKVRRVPRSASADPIGSLAGFWHATSIAEEDWCNKRGAVTPDVALQNLNDMYWIVSERDMPMLKDYAVTELQYDQFDYWARGRAGRSTIRWAPLFTELFGTTLNTKIAAFFKALHTPDEYFAELQQCLRRYAPAFLDMAHMGEMLGGSFMPGIEVGREGGRGENWSMFHGGTWYFPDLRFLPAHSATPHPPGMLTKDLAIPWFNDYIACDETYWPTSRAQIVYQEHGLAYQWLTGIEDDDMPDYWKKLGFIRRDPSGVLIEQESTFPRP